MEAPKNISNLRLGRHLVPLFAALLAVVLALATSQTRSPAEHGQELVSRVDLTYPDRAKTLVDKVIGADDTTFGGWETEVLSSAVDRQLKVLAKLIEDPGKIDVKHASGLVAEGFTCQALRGAQLREVFNDGIISVRRPEIRTSAAQAPSTAVYQEAQGFVEALKDLGESLGGNGEIRAELKVLGIHRSERLITARVLFEASNRLFEGSVQQNGIWLTRWIYPKREAPLLLWIGLEQYEESAINIRHGRLFVDCTESAMGSDVYGQQVAPGIDHWTARVSRLEEMSIFGHHGLAVGDVNGDGLEDIYVCEAGGLPNRLYVQNQDGTVTDVSSQSGVDWLERSAATLLVDLDNDGDQDLVVTLGSLIIFAENNGTGHFTVRSNQYAVDEPYSLSAADYDGDGDLDLYVCGYVNYRSSPGTEGLVSLGFEVIAPVPYYDANNGGANALLRNEGSFQFADVTDETGLNKNNTRYSFAAAWEDYDNDGDLDLYVANDFGRNSLYQNTDGRFTDVAAQAGVEDIASGMSVSWGDYNRDGWVDLYVGNMFSSAGRRVAYQRSFATRNSRQAVAHLQRMARGNTLYANAGDGTFHDVSESAGVTMGRWAWSSNFLDLNNDGWLDLLVANGYFSNEDTHDL